MSSHLPKLLKIDKVDWAKMSIETNRPVQDGEKATVTWATFPEYKSKFVGSVRLEVELSDGRRYHHEKRLTAIEALNIRMSGEPPRRMF